MENINSPPLSLREGTVVPTRQSTATVRLIRTLLKSTPNEHPGFCKNYPAKFNDKINH